MENYQIGIQHLETPGCETDGWFSNYFWSSSVKQLELNAESLCFNHMLFVWFKIFSGGLVAKLEKKCHGPNTYGSNCI